MPDRTELKRLILQIARDLCAQDHLRTLLAAADSTLVGHREELRAVKARIKRDSTKLTMGLILAVVLAAVPAFAQEPVVGVPNPESLFTDPNPTLHANKQVAPRKSAEDRHV